MATRVTVQRFLVESTSRALGSDGGDALGYQRALNPRKHQFGTDAVGIDQQNVRRLDHALEVEILLLRVEKLEHPGMGQRRRGLIDAPRGDPVFSRVEHRRIQIAARQTVDRVDP